jgi:vitamin B12 transporter
MRIETTDRHGLTQIVFICVLLVASVVWAQEQEEDQTQPIEYQMTVSGDRLEETTAEKTDSIVVITREQIELNQWNYVLDAVRSVPGVSVVQSGSPGKVTSLFLRGAGAAQVLVLLDGVPINNPYFGGVNFEDLTTDNVERIEVLKGPQSPLYGSDSIGGVIQIITRQGEGDTSIRTSFEGGSFDTFRERASLHGAQSAIDYSLSFSRQDAEGQFNNDEFSENIFSGRAGYKWSDNTRADFTVNVFDSQTGIPFHTIFDFATFLPALEASPLQNQESNLAVFSAGIKHGGGPLLNLRTQFAYTRRTFSFQDPGSFFADSTNDSDIFQLTVQNDLQWNEQNTLSGGYEFEHQNINAQDNLNGEYPLKSVDDHALFLQNKFETQSWILTAGFRYDHYNTFGDTFNPRVSAAYRWNRDTKVRASYGEGFRAPSAGDLGLPFYGNPNLKPEKSRSWEVGFDRSWNNGVLISASWFHNDYDELITFDPNTLVAGNVAEASAHGLELYVAFSYARWQIGAGYTYLDTEDEVAQLPLFRRPKHSGSFQLGYDTAKWGASLHLTAVGEKFENDFLTFPVQNVFNPGYGKLDLAAHYQLFESLRLKGRIENLLDKEYEEALHFPALPRGFYGGIEWTF